MTRGSGVAALLLLLPGCVVEPALPDEGVQWRAVSVGGAHACAIDADGRLACWGANDRGQAGLGGGDDWVDRPTYVPVDVRWRAVSAGWRHTCARSVDGGAWCWGANGAGQVGDGGTRDRRLPFQVSARGPFASVSAGFAHSCAVRGDGVALCWGAAAAGQAGVGPTDATAVPPTPVAGDERFGIVEAGGLHSCGVTAEGLAACWGSNDLGALGNGTLVSSDHPVAVAGADGLRSVAAGEGHTCGVDFAGRAYCWGANEDGQSAPISDPLVGNPTLRTGAYAAIGAGDRWSCGVGTGGRVRCWGRRWGSGGGRAEPGGWDPVPGRTVDPRSLGVGWRGACAVAPGAGELLCWGAAPR